MKMIGVCAELAVADQPGRLEAVHVRHVDVEQDDGEVGLSTCRRASSPEPRGDEVLAQLLQDGPVDEELLRQVVHDQDVRLVRLGHPRPVIGTVIEWAGSSVP